MISIDLISCHKLKLVFPQQAYYWKHFVLTVCKQYYGALQKKSKDYIRGVQFLNLPADNSIQYLPLSLSPAGAFPDDISYNDVNVGEREVS